jgi:hypothetical protein
MTHSKALELWETKIGNYEAPCPTAKSLMKRDGPKTRGPLGITYHSNEKANVIAHCLENQFTSHDLSDENYERRVETRVSQS